MVEVRFVDFGYKRTLSVKDLRHIKDEFFVLPEMVCLKCVVQRFLVLSITFTHCLQTFVCHKKWIRRVFY